MTKREYAEAIAVIVNGTVNEVEKANGIKKIGIIIKEEGSNIAPCIYIDEMYDGEMSVEEAVEKVKELYDYSKINTPFDTDSITDFDKIKPMVRVRLYNNKTKAEVFKSAEEYGFDDLIICPYALINNFNGSAGTVGIKNNMLDMWGVNAEEIINIGIENTKAEGYKLQSMAEVMIEMMGKEQAEMMGIVDDGRMYVLSNESKTFGAIEVILAADELKEKFPSGYIVIPSSIHEVIIVPKDVADKEILNGMVNDVNDGCVRDDEVLGNKVYIF